MSLALPHAGPVGTADAQEPPHEAMEQAADWYALLRSGVATDGDRLEWSRWLERDADHRHAWSYVEAVSRSFEPLQATQAPQATADGLWAANQRVLQRRRLLAGIALFGGSGLLGWATWRHTPLPLMAQAWRADHRTATGEIREVVLADGSRVWLNTATAFNLDYGADARRLQLLAGEILVETAHEAGRPFFVHTPQGRLQALGTRFTVRLDGEETLLAVYQGAVEVRTAEGAASAVIKAGRQIRFGRDALGAQAPADIAREAWSRGVLAANNVPLSEVVGELRRYRHGHLGLAPEVAGLRVFGSFPLHDTDEALKLLAYALPIQVRRTLPWWVSIEAVATGEKAGKAADKAAGKAGS